MKKFFTPDRILLVILLMGMIPATRSWPWAKVTIGMWLVLILLHLGKNHSFLTQLYTVILYICCAATAWAVFQSFFPTLPLAALAVVWLGWIGYTAWQAWTERETLWKMTTPAWPSRPLAAVFLCAVLLTGFGVHAWLNYSQGRPFTWTGWTSLTWMALTLTAFYPRQITKPFAFLNTKQRGLLIFHMVIILFNHYGKQTNLENKLYPHPAEVTQAAFSMGYQGLGVQSVILESARLYHQGDWAQAALHLRSHWAQDDQIDFAKAFRAHLLCQNNLFLFTMAFGCDLQLQPGEEAVDLLIRDQRRECFVLTSQGRLLHLGDKGLSTLWKLEQTPLTMTTSADQAHLAVLIAPNQVLFWSTAESFPILYLPEDGKWKDIQLSSTGPTVYALSGDGRVESHRFSQEKGIWEFEKTWNPPLWQDPASGKAILLAPDESGLLLLDAHGGLCWCGEPPLYGGLTGDDLARYYNPLAPPMETLCYWGAENQVALCNQNGRIHFIDPQHKTLLTPVKADLVFDKFNAQWAYRAQTVATVPVPALHTFYQLDKNGSIHPIVMPQRYRVLHRHKIFRVMT
ncbi:MAG: hypothetical protein RBU29_13990 [bacterium]|jgi:hypothetical protein|nr:hypothetical protein [bacterium]